MVGKRFGGKVGSVRSQSVTQEKRYTNGKRVSEVMQPIAHLACCGPRWDAFFLSLTDIDTSRTDVCRSVPCGHFSL